jgi:hypothetical protein
VGALFNTSGNNVWKWKRDRITIVQNAADDTLKHLRKVHRGKPPRWKTLEQKLGIAARGKRSVGRRVSVAWVVRNALRMFPILYPDEPTDAFSASYPWRRAFAKRERLGKRSVTNTKKESTADRLPKLQAFHVGLTLLLRTQKA